MLLHSGVPLAEHVPRRLLVHFGGQTGAQQSWLPSYTLHSFEQKPNSASCRHSSGQGPGGGVGLGVVDRVVMEGLVVVLLVVRLVVVGLVVVLLVVGVVVRLVVVLVVVVVGKLGAQHEGSSRTNL